MSEEGLLEYKEKLERKEVKQKQILVHDYARHRNPKTFQLVGVTWSKKPFEDAQVYRGTMAEITDIMQSREDCTFRCCKRPIQKCLHRVIFNKRSASVFEDKWHGFYASGEESICSRSNDEIIQHVKGIYGDDPWFCQESGTCVLYASK